MRSSLSASFCPYFSSQGNTRLWLTVEQFAQPTSSIDDDDEEGEQNGLSSLFDVPNSNTHAHITRIIEPTYDLSIRNKLRFAMRVTLRVANERQYQECTSSSAAR